MALPEHRLQGIEKGLMRMGIIADRQRKHRAAKWRKNLLSIAGAACALAIMAFVPSIRESIRSMDVQAFSQQSTQLDMKLEEYDVYALQLAVFDSGEHAANALKRLQGLGVRCVIWQKERMRIVADAAFSREALNVSAAKGQEAYVISDTLEEVSIRLHADAAGAAQAKRLLETPDQVLQALAKGNQPLAAIAAQTKELAEASVDSYPENTLYTQLAQSLINWSALMEKTLAETDEPTARSYGAVTMCTLCRELRQALSASSTASAQRTPSTAADVMPPA